MQAEPVEPVPAVSGKPEPVEPVPPEVEDEDDEEPAPPPFDTTSGTPVFVMLGKQGTNTRMPARNAMLAHSWGWGTATKATYDRCVMNARSVGEEMWCATEEKPAGSGELVARRKIRRNKSVFVEPADVADWGVAAPVGPVWLIGPERVCAAAVGRPIVGYYAVEGGGDFTDHFTFLELAWELTGCDAATREWSPIGVAAATFDESLRWVTSKAGPRERFDPATYKDALADEVAKLPGAAKKEHAEESDPPDWWMQTIELPGNDLRELFVAAAWRGEDSPDGAGEYGCGDSEYVRVFQHRRGTKIGDGSRGQLVGGLVGAGDAGYLVWTDSLEYSVARVEAQKLGSSLEIQTGGHHPEDGGQESYSLIGYCGP